MRTNLKVLRVREGLTQEEMSEKLGISRVTYSFIERGERQGNYEFWKRVQETFNIPDKRMYSLMRINEVGNNEKWAQNRNRTYWTMPST